MHRRLFDSRLRNVPRKYILRKDVWNTTEWIIFDAVCLERDLMPRGAKPSQVWEKLDSWLDVDGPSLPCRPSVVDYLASRMNYINPDFLALDACVLLNHIDTCTRWLEKNDPAESWLKLCSEHLDERLSDSEFEEWAEEEAVQSYENGRPVCPLDYFESKIERMKLRILDGDGLWKFHAPPRHGKALARDGRVIDHIVEVYACHIGR